ncbi:MAG: DUF2442 domain-containing protein [Prevotellaceae bacterium]|jgi:hypothetical protein|nr:DUF2442 domain-containing protein [Prevotellaceae bacterium]
MIWVVKAEKTSKKYEILIEFNDGVGGGVNFEKIFANDHRAIIRELLDESKFNAFFVENDTVNWKNGADFAPEFLYENIIKHKQVA